MAMIKCSECKQNISSNATACPHCGFAKPKRKPMGLGTGIILVVFVAYIASVVTEDPLSTPATPMAPKAPKTAEEIRQDEIRAAFSAWDGSHRELERWIKKNIKDPRSYEHIETRFGMDGDTVIVATTYRAKNSFGGYVVNTATAKARIDGSLIEANIGE